MTTEAPSFITITESGVLVELPKFNHIPHNILLLVAIPVARNDLLGAVRVLEEVESFRELRMFCDIHEQIQILKAWARDSYEESKP